MHHSALNREAAKENARSLAALLGIETERASELLAVSVLITVQDENHSARSFGDQLYKLLERTFASVTTEVAMTQPKIEVIVGQAIPRSNAQKIWVTISQSKAQIQRTAPSESGFVEVHPVAALVVVCYVAGAVTVLATHDTLSLPHPKPLILDLTTLGDLTDLNRPIDLNVSYLAGAGAIGNGFLWALQYFNVLGRLEIVDFDIVKSGNLQRQIWFDETDLGRSKAEQLALKAQPQFPHLALVPRVSRLEDLTERQTDERWLRRLIVAVDSRRARRSLQEEMPEEVFDASTTDVREIVLHYNKQPTSKACLGCIYPADTNESARADHIAEALGVSIEDVKQQQISVSAAERILIHYPDRGLTVESLVGEAYDSLFKNLCAETALKTPEGRQVFAPFGFVSVLAGALLAIDLVTRLSGTPLGYNHWTVSPWFPFSRRMRRDVEAIPGCEVCSVPIIQAVNDKLWAVSPRD